jgi:hypothetical protein
VENGAGTLPGGLASSFYMPGVATGGVNPVNVHGNNGSNGQVVVVFSGG